MSQDETATAVVAPTTDSSLAVEPKGVLPTDLSPEDAEALLLYGDLSKLSAEGRLVYYHKRCRDLGLDPLARPFDYIKVPHPEIPNVKRLILYANKTCGELLRQGHNISIVVVEEKLENGYFEVKVIGKTPIFNARGEIIDYRSEVEIGGVEVAGKSGQHLANLRMKAYTKAKRRVTLALCAAGVNDETEVETIKGAVRVSADVVEARSLTEPELVSIRSRFSPRLAVASQVPNEDTQSHSTDVSKDTKET